MSLSRHGHSRICPGLTPSRTPPGAACGRSRPDPPAPPSPRRSTCTRPASRRSRRRPCGTRSPAVAALVVVEREAPLAPRCATSRAPRRGCSEWKDSAFPLPAHDVRPRAHDARDDPELARPRAAPRPCASRARPSRSGARARRSCGGSSPPLRSASNGRRAARPRSAATTARHHQLAVRHGVVLRPLHGLARSRSKCSVPSGRYARSASGRLMNQRAHVLLRELDEVASRCGSPRRASRSAASPRRLSPRRGTAR